MLSIPKKPLIEMKSIIISISLALIVVACATSNKTFLPDGSEGYSIVCNGAAVGINVCFEEAGDICGACGYVILNREGQTIPFGGSVPLTV